MNFFVPLMLWVSFATRLPYEMPNPQDYEIALGFERKDTVYVERQWERQNGEYYVDEEYWVAYNIGSLWVRDKYVNKTSKDILYNQVDIRYKTGGYSLGYAWKYYDAIGHSYAVAGYRVDKWVNYKLLAARFLVELEVSTNFKEKPDTRVNIGPKLDIGSLLDVSLIYQVETFQGKLIRSRSKIKFEVTL